MNLQSTLVIYIKELKDILRDRRTIISTVLFPILMFPLLYVGMGAFMAKRMGDLEEKRSVVAWVAYESLPELVQRIEKADIVDLITDVADSSVAIEMMKDKAVDAVIVVPRGFNESLEQVLTGTEGKSPGLMLYLNKTRQTSEFAASKLFGVIDEYRAEITKATLSAQGINPDMVKPFVVNYNNVVTTEEMGGFVLGMILPYILILMLLVGAMYPAIDLTAGEKERGTLETLLVAGVSRIDIVLGKFLTVLTASVITALLAIGSMSFTAWIGVKIFKEVSEKINISIDPQIIFVLLIVVLPLAVLFSSLLMTLSIYAKSYKEAQSYISPLMIFAIVPSMASMVPDLELTVQMSFIPILNVSLLLKQGFNDTIDPTLMLLVIVVNFVLAAGGLYLVTKMFRRESVLFRI